MYCNLYTIELSLAMFGLIFLKAGPAPKRSIDRQMLKYLGDLTKRLPESAGVVPSTALVAARTVRVQSSNS